MNAFIALKSMEALTQRLASYYGWLGDLFSSERELSAVLQRLSREEKARVALIHMERSLLRKEPGLFRASSLEIPDLNGAAAHLEKLMGGSRIPSPCSALVGAIEAEAVRAKHYYRDGDAPPDEILEHLFLILSFAAVRNQKELCGLLIRLSHASAPDLHAREALVS